MRDLTGLAQGFERGPHGQAQTARSSPYESRLGPMRDIHGHHGPPFRGTEMTLGCHGPSPDGARAGIDWAALARTNPMLPMVARTNPAWDQAGLAIWVGARIYCFLVEICTDNYGILIGIPLIWPCQTFYNFFEKKMPGPYEIST